MLYCETWIHCSWRDCRKQTVNARKWQLWQNKNFVFCTQAYKNNRQIKSNVQCLHVNNFLTKSVNGNWFVLSRMFQTKQCQFQVQNVLFLTSSIAVLMTEWCNRFISTTVFGTLVTGSRLCLSFPLSSPAATSCMILTQLIWSGNTKCIQLM